MGRTYAAAAAAASHFYRTIRKMKLQVSMGAAVPPLLDHLASMRPKAIPNKCVSPGTVRVVLHPEDFHRLKLAEKVYSDCLQQLEEDISRQSAKDEKSLEIASNFMVLLSLIECGGLGLGTVVHLSHSSDMASHLLKKFTGEYDVAASLDQHSIDTKLELIQALTQNLALRPGGAVVPPVDAVVPELE